MFNQGFVVIIGVVVLGVALAYGIWKTSGKFPGYGRPIDSQPDQPEDRK